MKHMMDAHTAMRMAPTMVGVQHRPGRDACRSSCGGSSPTHKLGPDLGGMFLLQSIMSWHGNHFEAQPWQAVPPGSPTCWPGRRQAGMNSLILSNYARNWFKCLEMR